MIIIQSILGLLWVWGFVYAILWFGALAGVQ